MRRLAASLLLVGLIGLIGGCASMRAHEIEAAWKRTEAIANECRDRRLRGELSGHVASAECSQSRMRAEMISVGYPYMDLIDLWLAYRMAGAKRIDAGQMTQSEFELQFAEFIVRFNNEVMRRDLAQQQAAAQRAAAWGAMMQGWGAMQQSLQPPSGPIHCVTAANTITCY